MNQKNLQSERQKQVMDKANLLTNLAYLCADVANSFAIDCMALIKHLPVFAITEKEIVDYVISQRPSLKNKPFTIAF